MTWALRTDLPLEALEIHAAALDAAGLLGIDEQDGRATAWFPRRVEGLPVDGGWVQVPERDWNAESRARLTPVTVGALTVAPPWAAGDGDLVIDPGQAFGTGHHETTTGCLAALQELDVRGSRVLDVGTGSGVLAIAAVRLGARAAVGVDIDPAAVSAARGNAAANGVSIDVRLGSVDVVDGTYDVVLANLDTATLSALAPAIAARLASRGTLVASGVSLERSDEALAALAAAGLQAWPRPGAEWTVLVARHAR